MSVCVFPRFPQARLSQLLEVLPEGYDLKGKSILDYGGNRGNLLEDAILEKLIDPKDYTSMDVDSQGLVYLRNNFPNTNIIHYDRYNPAYRAHGQKMIPFPQDDNTYDIVYSYSVNTHSSWQDFVFDVKELARVCKPGGLIYTSSMDKDVMKTMHNKRLDDYGSAVDYDIFDDVTSGKLPGVYLIDNDLTLNLDEEIPLNVKFLLAYYNFDWLLKEFEALGFTATLFPHSHPDIMPLIRLEDNY